MPRRPIDASRVYPRPRLRANAAPIDRPPRHLPSPILGDAPGRDDHDATNDQVVELLIEAAKRLRDSSHRNWS
jgi:hypothetical protein